MNNQQIVFASKSSKINFLLVNSLKNFGIGLLYVFKALWQFSLIFITIVTPFRG